MCNLIQCMPQSHAIGPYFEIMSRHRSCQLIAQMAMQDTHSEDDSHANTQTHTQFNVDPTSATLDQH